MRGFKSVFSHRYGPAAVVVLMVCAICFVTRLVLLVMSWDSLDFSFLNIAGIFLVGFLYDLVVGSYFAIPVAIYCWLMKNSWFRQKWQQIPLFILFSFIIFILLIVAGSEIGFWEEFNVRFNYLAVDYIFFTDEVVGSIWESYNFFYIFSGIMLAAIGILFLCRKMLTASQGGNMSFVQRTLYFFVFMIFPVMGYFLVNNSFKNISKNNFINELGGNGLYEFGVSYLNNEIGYDEFYVRRAEKENFAKLREMLQAPNATFTGDPLSIDRVIKNDSPERKWNVVLISVESLSAEYLQYFGNREKITPYLDSLIPHSLFFKNFYASGTRTIRGLEALSLAIPPTPGKSILRRPNNEGLFTIGSVFKSKGYDVKFIYGGNSAFDNMGYFFSNNGYKVLDKDEIPSKLVTHSTSWGVDDEATLNYTLQQCDESFRNRKLFFSHVMTMSNHRPYTYPDGRIDIPSATRTAQGSVKYTDYALNKFLKDAAKRPWFDNTIFVMVADHAARSAGKTDLPVNRYHIPCFIFAPKLVTPAIEQKLASQVDLAPTILGLLNMNYTNRFFGMDMLNSPKGRERIFISTYQKLGYIRNNKLVILSPYQKVTTYQPDFLTGTGTQIPDTDSLINEAIAWYEGASYLFRNGRYQRIAR